MNHLGPPLNSRQAEVLRWIADGCPDGVMQGEGHKISAVALQRRQLIKINGSAGQWYAHLTEVGAYYIRHGRYPSGTAPASGSRSLQSDSGRDSLRDTSGLGRRSARVKSRAAKPDEPSATDRMIAELLANGGQLAVPAPERSRARARVAAARRYGKMPEGKEIVLTWAGSGEGSVVRLCDAPKPIPVSSKPRQPHPVVRSLRDAGGPAGIAPSVRPRALRLLHVLAHEAESRGYKVRVGDIAQDFYGQERSDRRKDLSIAIGGHSVRVQVRQVVERTRHKASPVERANAEKYPGYHIRQFDDAATDRLALMLVGGVELRGSRWADSASRRLEECLAEVLWEAEQRAAEAEQRRTAVLAAAEERRRQWEAAMERARKDYAEAYMDGLLREQVEAWTYADRLRGYLSAMRSSIETVTNPADAEAMKAWLVWAECRANRTDPLAGRLETPVVPDPEPADLTPFLRGWSPYGPG